MPKKPALAYDLDHLQDTGVLAYDLDKFVREHNAYEKEVRKRPDFSTVRAGGSSTAPHVLPPIEFSPMQNDPASEPPLTTKIRELLGRIPSPFER